MRIVTRGSGDRLALLVAGWKGWLCEVGAFGIRNCWICGCWELGGHPIITGLDCGGIGGNLKLAGIFSLGG
jgi:hypothetical protein